MKGEDAYKLATEEVVKNINSWDDLYKYFDRLAAQVRETQSPTAFMHAFFSMYAFIVALRELPDEGDARVLADRMLRNLLLDGKEKIGFEVSIATVEELREMAEGHIKEVLQAAFSMAKAREEAAETEAPQGTQGKRVLH